MADTFSQIYIQIVFAVKHRQALIARSWEDELYKYITGVVQQRGNKMLAINGMPDHIHIFIGMKPSERISDLVREIKKSSVAYVKEQRFTPFTFHWQAGYGAFSYSRSAISNVCNYIERQKEHHKENNFKMEFEDFLRQAGIELTREELFDFFED